MLSGWIPPNTSAGNFIWGIVFLLASICLFLFAREGIKNRIEFIQSASRANGVVIGKANGKYHADIQFNTAKGEVVKYIQHGNTSFEVGEKVTVLYHAENPRNAPCADAFGALWGGDITLIGVGILTLFFSWVSIFKPEYVV